MTSQKVFEALDYIESDVRDLTEFADEFGSENDELTPDQEATFKRYLRNLQQTIANL